MSILLGQPINVTNVGNVYPIKLKDYSRFSMFAWTMEKTKASIDMQDSEEELLHLLILEDMKQEDEDKRGMIIPCLIELIKMVTREEVKFISETMSFIIGKSDSEDSSERFLNYSNFEEFRKVVAKQNLIVEKRYYKPLFQKMIDDEKKRRASKGGLSLDTILSILSVEMGVNYDFLAEMTYAQIITNFKRIMLKESYKTGIQFKASGNYKDVIIDNYTGEIDLYQHPDDEIYAKGKNPFSKLM